MTLNVGERAPDFVLRDGERRPVSLDDFQDRNVVIAFYLLAFTGG